MPCQIKLNNRSEPKDGPG